MLAFILVIEENFGKKLNFFNKKKNTFFLKFNNYRMCFPDFITFWDQVQICHLSIDSTIDTLSSRSALNNV